MEPLWEEETHTQGIARIVSAWVVWIGIKEAGHFSQNASITVSRSRCRQPKCPVHLSVFKRSQEHTPFCCLGLFPQ